MDASSVRLVRGVPSLWKPSRFVFDISSRTMVDFSYTSGTIVMTKPNSALPVLRNLLFFSVVTVVAPGLLVVRVIGSVCPRIVILMSEVSVAVSVTSSSPSPITGKRVTLSTVPVPLFQMSSVPLVTTFALLLLTRKSR
ncbi:hypothetical protein SDC9_159163 [bioreactor metagenome]|uniref:Uncharacterized protein n=1 Tax=bioreactor metagenome TaxID=1076179 RepID=A0A645FBW4_9ZZZZ